MSAIQPIPEFVSTQPGNQSGVYAIANLRNGRLYIGSSAHIKTRWLQHRSALSRNCSPHRHLQASWNKYGGSIAFKFGVLEFCPVSDLIAREQVYLDRFESYKADRGYNTRIIADSPLGVRHSAETRAKHSVTMKIALSSPEARAKRAATSKVVNNRPGAREKMSQALTRPGVRERHRAATLAAVNKPEIKARHKASINTPDEKLRKSKAIRASWERRRSEGRTEVSAEHRRKIADALRESLRKKKAVGIPHHASSEASRAAMRAGWARRKAAKRAAATSTTFYVSGTDGTPPESIQAIQRTLFDP